jgi:hypothetical protein
MMDGWRPPGNAEDDTECAAAARKEFGLLIMADDRPQYLTVGIQLGERYENSPLTSPDVTPGPPDSWDVYIPSDRPGGRAPHFEISPGRPACDECGPGFTLFDFAGPNSDTSVPQALATVSAHRKVPLKVVRCAAPPGLHARNFVLIRPDCHIAWHGDSIDDPMAVIDRARGSGV